MPATDTELLRRRGRERSFDVICCRFKQFKRASEKGGRQIATICPRCGNTIQNETNPTCYNCLRIDQDHKRFGRRRPRKRQKKQSNPPTAQRSVSKRQQTEPTPSNAVERYPQLTAINHLLADLYQPERRLSHILKDGRLSQQEIKRLKNRYLVRYLDKLVNEVQQFWKKKLQWQEYEMLRAKYGLDAKPRANTGSLANLYGFSREQAEKYLERALRRMRFQSLIKRFEELVVRTAKDVLRSG